MYLFQRLGYLSLGFIGEPHADWSDVERAVARPCPNKRIVLCGSSTLEGTMIELDRLAQQEVIASAASWHVRYLDDDRCMNAVGISTEPDTGKHENLPSFDYPEPNLLALCLLQWPPHVVPRDQKWEENAELIVAMRNALPELLRLARLGAMLEGLS